MYEWKSKNIGMISELGGNFGVSYALTGVWVAKRVRRLVGGYPDLELIDAELLVGMSPFLKRKSPAIGFISKPEEFHNPQELALEAAMGA